MEKLSHFCTFLWSMAPPTASIFQWPQTFSWREVSSILFGCRTVALIRTARVWVCNYWILMRTKKTQTSQPWEPSSGTRVHFSCHELKTGSRHVMGQNHFYYTCVFAIYQIFRNKSLEDFGEERRRKKKPSFCLLTPPVDEKIAMTVF